MGLSALSVVPSTVSIPTTSKTSAIDVTESIKEKFGLGYAKALLAIQALHDHDSFCKPVLAGEGLLNLIENHRSRSPLTVLVKNGRSGKTESGFLKESKPKVGDFRLSIQFGRESGSQQLAEEHGIAMNAKGNIFVRADIAAQKGWTASRPN